MAIEEYDLGIARFDDLEIICGSFKLSFKHDLDVVDSTASYDSIGYKKKKRTYEFEASDINPELIGSIKDIWVAGKKGIVSTYNIIEDGSYVEGTVLADAIITEWDTEQGEGNTVSLKGQALCMIQ